MTLTRHETQALLLRLSHLANVRDRAVDHEPRIITITEDEALALLDLINLEALT